MSEGVPMILLLRRRHLHQEVDRWGNRRIYFRVGRGPRVRIRETPGTEEFDKRYHELLRQAVAGLLKPAPRDEPSPFTFRWLCQKYMASREFQDLDARTRYVRRQLVDHMCAESIAREAGSPSFADCPLGKFGATAVKILRDRKSDAPEAGNARVKTIRAVFSWALDNDVDGVNGNPARDVRFLKPKRVGGFPTWTLEDIAQFETRHPVGTKARLAFDLLRYTGVRRSDVIRLGRQNLDGTVLSFTAFKGRNKTPVRIDMEIGPALQASLSAARTGDMVYLVTEHGKPYTHAGFGNWFRRQCDLAGLKDRSAHGLRKAAAAAAADEGLTAHQLMARFGWLTLKQAERYTRTADRKRLGLSGSRQLNRSEGEQNSLTSDAETPLVRENGSKSAG